MLKTLFLTNKCLSNNIKLLEDSSCQIDDTDEVVIGVEYVESDPLVEINSANNASTFTKKYPPPKTIFISRLDNMSLDLIKPIPITLEYWDDCVTAYSYDLDEYGVGPDEVDALRNIRLSISDVYFMLKDESENLGPIPRGHWEFLRGIIKER